MYDLDYNLRNLFSVRQFWKENTNFKMNSPRKSSCLLLLCGCSAIYKFDSLSLTVPRGSVLYIPEGAVYETKFFDCDTTLPATILIEFSLVINDVNFRVSDTPIILKQGSNVMLNEWFNDAADIYSSAVISLSRLKSIVYNLLWYLSDNERK